eukprot:PITA_02408
MNVKSTFLNGYVDEEIYVEQPEGFEVPGKEDYVYKLKKALYGLKQAPRDGIQELVRNSTKLFQRFKSHMVAEFEMIDLGELHYFLGIEVWQKEDGIFMSQAKYTWDILKKFRMLSCKPATTPLEVGLKSYRHDDSNSVDVTLYHQLVGSLIYLTTTRPNISFAVSMVSRFMAKPKELHWKVVKRILRYLRGTVGYGLVYRSIEDFRLIGYADSDWAGCMDDRKSTLGYSFSMGSATVAWSTNKQSTISLLTTEAEYKAVATATTTCEAIWLRRILEDLHEQQEQPTQLTCDNQSAIQMTKNPVFHNKTMHIDIQYHFVRDLVQQGVIEIEYCRTNK